jgi:hypothetical protein
MNNRKFLGHVLYAIGIIGGVEGATMPRGMTAMGASIVALIVIIIGAYLLEI